MKFALAVAITLAVPVFAEPFTFSTGNIIDQMAIATRPDASGKFEIEGADDFLLTAPVLLTSATFAGLLTGGATTSDVGQVVVEIYRVFPNDSDVGRTSGAPTFSTTQVPTRVNSPSDVAFDSRDSGASGLTFSTAVLSSTFSALNSVQPGGIHAKPGQTTGGDKAVTGTEVQFSVNFATPFLLPAGHYFFVPQVEVTSANGEFLWLSGTRPIIAPGTPFMPDLQAWTRDEFLDPDWLRVGTDIVGGTPAPTFNGAFSLNGTTVPEAGSLTLMAIGLFGFGLGLRRQR